MSLTPLIPINGANNDDEAPVPSQAEQEIVPIQDQTPVNTPVNAAWSAYEQHLRKWFYNPDIEAARIVLAAAAAHFHKDCDPCWLFVLGPSSGDKSSICINSLLSLPQVTMMGDLSSKTLLSGYTGTAHPSLLHQIGNGILAFKDFTTFASKRPEEQSEISSQFREVYDGSFVKNTGKGNIISWKGKITIIAAATPVLERAWASKRDLGERFLQVRINRKDGIQQSESAQRQRGFEEHITSTMRELARAFFQCNPPITYPPPKLSNSQMLRVSAMAELVAHCRGAVPRNPITGAICDLPQIENSGRMSKSIASLIANHAALFRRSTVTEEDMAIGRRVALNTIPALRSLVIDTVPIQGFIGSDRLQLVTGQAESTISYVIAELECLGVLRVKHNTIVANEVSLTPNLTSLWSQAFPPIPAPRLDPPLPPPVIPQGQARTPVH